VICLRETRPTAAEVSEIASADMQFRRENSNQRQPRPLSEAETSEKLFPRVLQGRLYAINGRNWHGRTSIPQEHRKANLLRKQ
jgi:hypothetical protein